MQATFLVLILRSDIRVYQQQDDRPSCRVSCEVLPLALRVSKTQRPRYNQEIDPTPKCDQIRDEESERSRVGWNGRVAWSSFCRGAMPSFFDFITAWR